jgi:lipopolysaccharide export system permease protein
VPLLDRALLREMLGPLFVALFALLQLLVIAQLLQLNEVVLGPAVALSDIARVTVALAPHFLVLAAPVAFMLAVQLALGRLSGDHELLALSAAGRSPLQLYRVPAALAAFLGLGAAALATWAEPWGLRQLHGVLNDVIKRNMGSAVVPGVFSEDLPRFMLYVDSVQEPAVADPQQALAARTLRGVLIENSIGDGPALLALAEEGHIVDAGGEALALQLQRGELHRPENAGTAVARFESGTFRIGVQERLWRKNRFYATEGGLSSAALEARALALEREDKRSEAARLRVTRARRWSVPLACLAFAILGVPLAASSRGARGFAYLVTIFAFAGFFVLQKLAETLAERGRLSPWSAAFLPDVAVAALGALLTARLLQAGVGKPR